MLRSIAAPGECNCFHSPSPLRCVSKHEGPTWPVLILRDARALVPGLQQLTARALLRMRTEKRVPICDLSLTRSLQFHLTISNSPSRSRGAFLRRGFAAFASLPPIEGWAERRETFGCVRGPRWTRHNAACQALARRLASHNAGRSPLGAPPWRFLGSGPPLPPPPDPDPCNQLLPARAVGLAG